MRRQIPGGIHQIQYGTTCIEYEVVYSARKTLAVSVMPDGAVVVNAPEGVPNLRIAETVERRAGWILKQQRHFKTLERPQSPRREYVSGEAYRFLGRQLRLKVIESSVARVRRSRTILTVETSEPTNHLTVGQQVENWFDAHAARIFTERLEVCFSRVAHWGCPIPKLSIRPMKARWGSLTPKGTLTLNRKLIQAPVELIDYVILHELCHLREMNHSAAFYTLLSQVLPTWREHRQALNRYDFI
jgi:predicted metal-dependent hydrolase